MNRRPAKLSLAQEDRWNRMLWGNFFADMPPGMKQSVYLREVADREAARFGPTDVLVSDYNRIALWLEEQGL